MNLFIVEDSEDVRERLASLLGDIASLHILGHASDARSAMEELSRLMASHTCPDAVVLDIQLAEGNGMGVLKFIKTYAPATTVIMLTNYAYPQYQKHCMDEGADYFFDKSAEFMKVREVLEKMAAG
jgi:DNA-binding NarL/FixJ family response regulator